VIFRHTEYEHLMSNDKNVTLLISFVRFSSDRDRERLQRGAENRDGSVEQASRLHVVQLFSRLVWARYRPLLDLTL